jgi:hypothetical protein
MCLYDEVLASKEIPHEWENAVIDATTVAFDGDDPEYLFACSWLLFKIGSRWEGLSRAVQRALELRPTISYVQLAHQLQITGHGTEDLLKTAQRAAKKLPWIAQLIVRCTGAWPR